MYCSPSGLLLWEKPTIGSAQGELWYAYIRHHNTITLKLWKKHGRHVRARRPMRFCSVPVYIRVSLASQSYPFCDFKEWFREEAADRGWAFTFAFHWSGVRATAERRLPQAHFEVRPQSRQCLHSSGTLRPPAHRLLHTRLCIRLLQMPAEILIRPNVFTADDYY